jgi:pimeloyl-ACP methyl ester carboxylesterase
VTDEEVDLYALLNEGLALYRAEKFFEAHEIWEYAWGQEVGRTKLCLQALIQIAAALYKHQTKNPRGTSKLLAKAKDKIAEVRDGASCWLGIDLVQLAKDVDRALDDADAIASGDPRPLSFPGLPERTGPDGVLYLHGFASGPSSAKARLIVPPFESKGYFVAVPDQNEGDFLHLTMTRALDLAKRHLRDRTLIVGSSLGGYLASLIAQRDDRVKAMVLMAPAFDLAARLRARYGEEQLRRWQKNGSIEVDHYAWGGKRAIGYGFIEDAEKQPARPPIRVPTYILQGRRDEVVDPAIVTEVAKQNAAFVELDLVDDEHALTDSAKRALEAAESMAARIRLQPEPSAADVAGALARLAEIERARAED